MLTGARIMMKVDGEGVIIRGIMTRKRKLTKCSQCGAIGVPLKHRGRRWMCGICDRAPAMRDTATNAFAFETMHIGGDPSAGPIQVQNLNHLRRLEKEHGVISVLANYDNQSYPLRGGKEQFRDKGMR